jgi:restriction system protein
MPRKKKSGFIEDIFEIATLLPWWADCIVALVAYWFLHHYATLSPPPIQAGAPNQLSQAMVGPILGALAMLGQYVLPMLFLAGAGISFFKRKSRMNLFSRASGDKSGEVLRSMSWQSFERLIGEAFRQRGFTVLETGGGGPDGGIDLKLKKNNETFFVQCKHYWRADKISVDVVRGLYGVMNREGADGGFVVTTGTFTDAAHDFAKGINLELIDGSALRKMLDGVSMTDVLSQPEQAMPPACPHCGNPMVKRVAKQGANAGKPFWGCPLFPKCRGIRNIA